jgi:hypothetical protein
VNTWRDKIVTVLLFAAIANLVFAIFAGIKWGTHLGVMIALVSHVMFRTIKIITR